MPIILRKVSYLSKAFPLYCFSEGKLSGMPQFLIFFTKKSDKFIVDIDDFEIVKRQDMETESINTKPLYNALPLFDLKNKAETTASNRESEASALGKKSLLSLSKSSKNKIKIKEKKLSEIKIRLKTKIDAMWKKIYFEKRKKLDGDKDFEIRKPLKHEDYALKSTESFDAAELHNLADSFKTESKTDDILTFSDSSEVENSILTLQDLYSEAIHLIEKMYQEAETNLNEFISSSVYKDKLLSILKNAEKGNLISKNNYDKIIESLDDLDLEIIYQIDNIKFYLYEIILTELNPNKKTIYNLKTRIHELEQQNLEITENINAGREDQLEIRHLVRMNGKNKNIKIQPQKLKELREDFKILKQIETFLVNMRYANEQEKEVCEQEINKLLVTLSPVKSTRRVKIDDRIQEKLIPQNPKKFVEDYIQAFEFANQEANQVINYVETKTKIDLKIKNYLNKNSFFGFYSEFKKELDQQMDYKMISKKLSFS
jgi:hypothetical protein